MSESAALFSTGRDETYARHIFNNVLDGICRREDEEEESEGKKRKRASDRRVTPSVRLGCFTVGNVR